MKKALAFAALLAFAGCAHVGTYDIAGLNLEMPATLPKNVKIIDHGSVGTTFAYSDTAGDIHGFVSAERDNLDQSESAKERCQKSLRTDAFTMSTDRNGVVTCVGQGIKTYQIVKDDQLLSFVVHDAPEQKVFNTLDGLARDLVEMAR